MFEAPLKGRKKYWLIEFILSIILMECVYLSGYINSKYVTTWKEGPDDAFEVINFIPNAKTRNFIIFCAYWFGIYRAPEDDFKDFNDHSHIIYLFWPFYLMFILLIIERFCQFWLSDRFGCTDVELTE